LNLRRGLGALVATLAAVVVLGVPSGAHGATVTLGGVPSADEHADLGETCNSCRFFQGSSGAGSPSYEVPSGDWVLTSWSTRIGPPVSSLSVFGVEPSGSNYVLRFNSAPRSGVPFQVNTFSERIPVEPGWKLGLFTGNGAVGPYFTGNAADVVRSFSSAAAVDGPAEPAPPTYPGSRINLAATLESDDDGDGFGDETQDNCVGTSNPDQADTDSDGVGDVCDNCSGQGNAAQDNADNDPLGDACDPDDDNDNVADGSDNCQTFANPGQANTDGDPLGNACDANDDNDGRPDSSDSCPTTPASTPDGCPDATAPETEITQAPPAEGKKRRVKFVFTSSEPGSSFECRIDALAYEPCTSPLRVKLKRGRHKFSVRATDAAGNTDATPAVGSWTVPLAASDLAKGKGWKLKRSAAAYGGTVLQAKRKGAVLTHAVTGAREVALVVGKGRRHGKVKVYAGSRLVGTVRLAASSASSRQLVTLATFSEPFTGSLRIVVATKDRPVRIEGLGVATR
jgi:hypothetical protein